MTGLADLTTSISATYLQPVSRARLVMWAIEDYRIDTLPTLVLPWARLPRSKRTVFTSIHPFLMQHLRPTFRREQIEIPIFLEYVGAFGYWDFGRRLAYQFGGPQ